MQIRYSMVMKRLAHKCQKHGDLGNVSSNQEQTKGKEVRELRINTVWPPGYRWWHAYTDLHTDLSEKTGNQCSIALQWHDKSTMVTLVNP
jgi:hypothetical protein